MLAKCSVGSGVSEPAEGAKKIIYLNESVRSEAREPRKERKLKPAIREALGQRKGGFALHAIWQAGSGRGKEERAGMRITVGGGGEAGREDMAWTREFLQDARRESEEWRRGSAGIIRWFLGAMALEQRATKVSPSQPSQEEWSAETYLHTMPALGGYFLEFAVVDKIV